MPIKRIKPITQKVSDVVSRENVDHVIHEMGKVGGQLKSLVKYAKNRFDQADEKTKKKVLQGFAGAAAVLAALIGARKIAKRRKK